VAPLTYSLCPAQSRSS